MSISGGSCRLCFFTQQQRTPPHFPDDQAQRRRRRRHRNSGSLQQHQGQDWPTKQPKIVMILYNEDGDEKIAGKSDLTASTVGTRSPQTSGIILCKWLQTASSHFNGLFREAGSNMEPKNCDTNILEFDKTVVMIAKDAMIGGDSGENILRKDGIDMFLRSYSEGNCKMDNVNMNISGLISWKVRKADPDVVRSLCSSDDEFRSRHNNSPSSRCYVTIENNPEQPFSSENGVAIPLFSPSVSFRPLQSMVISIVASAELGLSPSRSRFQFDSRQNQADHGSDDRLSILMQTFWKRQLVGKVIAFEDRWTSAIRLKADVNIYNDDQSIDLNGDRRAEANQSDTSGNTVYVVVESCTPLGITTRPSTSRVKGDEDCKGSLSVPSNFYMVLPSTYVTIRPSFEQGSVQKPGGVVLDSTPSDSMDDCRPSSLRPPSAVASLLKDTINCIRSQDLRNGDVPRTFLLSGPPGVGKTFSVSWVAKTLPDILLCSIRGSEILQSTAHRKNADNTIDSPARALESEFLKMVNEIAFRERQGRGDGCAVTGLIFLDECDALVSLDPIAAMLGDLLDRISPTPTSCSKYGGKNISERHWKKIIVVGATNRIDSIPSYLRRSGRFDRELPMHPPSAIKRAEILLSMLRNAQCGGSGKATTNESSNEEYTGNTSSFENDIQEFAELCVGYVAADLSALVRKAWLLSLQGIRNGTNTITLSHLEAARNLVGASALRDASLAAPPKIKWNDIGGDPGGAKTALRQAIEWPRLKAREFAILGLEPCRGILLHGPPGCAKTTLARAAAGSSGVAFLSLSPAQVYASSYVGEAERVVREAFHLARSTAPCILFFDEIDSIFGSGNCGNDSGGLGGSGRGSSAEARVLSTFLNEMDGVDVASAAKDGVLVLGATNRPWTLDPALLRPGRLGDKIIFLPPPDKEARRCIFERQFGDAVNNNKEVDKMSWNLDISILTELSNGMTGAEIVGACQEAKMNWLRDIVLDSDPFRHESLNPNESLQQNYVVDALTSIKPLLSNPEALEEFRIFENRDKRSFNQ